MWALVETALWFPSSGGRRFSVHGCGSVHAVVKLREDVRDLHHLSEGPFLERMEPMARPSKYSPEVRERSVRLVQDHAAEHRSQWAAIRVRRAESSGARLRRCGAGCAKPNAMPASAPA